MSLQRNYLGTGLNASGVSAFQCVDGLIPQSWAGGPPMFTLTGNSNLTLSTGQSGSVIVVSPNANITVTLPAQPAAECNFRFLTGSNANTTNIVSPNTGVVYGPLLANAAVIACAANTAIKINTASLLGDSLEFLSDGTRWNVRGLASGPAAWTVS